jgi:hypothetical protein
MWIEDIANQIYLNAGQPTYTSIPSIAFWLRSKVGTLNTLLYEDFSVITSPNPINSQGQPISQWQIYDGNGNEISDLAVAIFQQLYRLYDLEIQIRNMMNALSSDSTILVDDNGSRIKRTDKNEIAKTLIVWRKDEIKIFNDLVTAYRCGAGVPSQIAGDDTIAGTYIPQYGLPYRRF